MAFVAITRSELAGVMDQLLGRTLEVDEPQHILLNMMREYDDEPRGLEWAIEALIALFAQSERVQWATAKKTLQRMCNKMREAGQREYAHDEDNAFANFDRLAKKLKLPRQTVLKVYLEKHLDGIDAWASGHVSQREPVAGRICDAITYLTILHAMKQADGA